VKEALELETSYIKEATVKEKEEPKTVKNFFVKISLKHHLKTQHVSVIII
jgi:hypothetical protein